MQDVQRPTLTEGVFLELRGDRRLIAEGLETLLEYGDTRISFCGHGETVTLEGEGLEMKFLSDTRMVIDGRLRAVRMERTGFENNAGKKGAR